MLFPFLLSKMKGHTRNILKFTTVLSFNPIIHYIFQQYLKNTFCQIWMPCVQFYFVLLHLIECRGHRSTANRVSCVVIDLHSDHSLYICGNRVANGDWERHLMSTSTQRATSLNCVARVSSWQIVRLFPIGGHNVSSNGQPGHSTGQLNTDGNGDSITMS